MPFTRGWLVDDFLKMFEQLEIDWNTTEVVFYNDTNDMTLQNKLRDFMLKRVNKFGGFYLQMSHEDPLDELGDRNHANKRRERIIKMRYKAQVMLRDTKYLFCLEDDTFAPPNAFKKLRKVLDDNGSAALASGVEMGRWAYKHIGAWKMEPVDNPQVIESMPYQREGITEADGTGMYCFVTYTQLYKQASFRNEAEPLGPDVLYGLDLRKKGRKVLVDWSVVCEHRGTTGSFMPKDAIEVVTYSKGSGVWKYSPRIS